ncbi:hypothetical protein [Massilia phosphatilytica]
MADSGRLAVEIAVLAVATAAAPAAACGWWAARDDSPRVQELLGYRPAAHGGNRPARSFVSGTQGDIQLRITNPKLLAGIVALASTCGGTCCRPSLSACWYSVLPTHSHVFQGLA